jgi:hypothetical protein
MQQDYREKAIFGYETKLKNVRNCGSPVTSYE